MLFTFMYLYKQVDLQLEFKQVLLSINLRGYANSVRRVVNKGVARHEQLREVFLSPWDGTNQQQSH